MKTNLKPLIDEGYRFFAINKSNDCIIVDKFKTFDDAKSNYLVGEANIYTAERLMEMLPELFELKEEHKLDLTKILHDCPKGTPLYSPLFGEMEFLEIDDGVSYPIKLRDIEQDVVNFTRYGKYINCENGECLLFPSRECRDWSQFVPPMPEPEHEPEPKPEPKFKPFDRVLVRDRIDNVWVAQLYSHCREDEGYLHFCVGGQFWLQCIPYEGNEHLLGTTDKPKEE